MTNFIKALSKDKNIRYYVVDTTEIIKEIQTRHKPSLPALISLAKVATFASMYGPSILSSGEKATIIIDGKGTIGQIYCDVNSKGEVKIFATNPSAEILVNNNKPNINTVIGNDGTIKIIKDLGMKRSYSGLSPLLLNQDIIQSFSYFMKTSEQKPTVFGVGFDFSENGDLVKCGGYMIQLLPGASEDSINFVEKTVKIIPNPNQLVKEFKLEEILEFISRNDMNVIEKAEVKFRCDCNKKRFIAKLKTINEEDINSIFEQEDIEVICEFCKEKYQINRGDLSE